MAYAILQPHHPAKVDFIVNDMAPLLTKIMSVETMQSRLNQPGGYTLHVRAQAGLTYPVIYANGYSEPDLGVARVLLKTFEQWQDDTTGEFQTADGVIHQQPALPVKIQNLPDYAILRVYSPVLAAHLSRDLHWDCYTRESVNQIEERLAQTGGYIVNVRRSYEDSSEENVGLWAFESHKKALRFSRTYGSWYDYVGNYSQDYSGRRHKISGPLRKRKPAFSDPDGQVIT